MIWTEADLDFSTFTSGSKTCFQRDFTLRNTVEWGLQLQTVLKTVRYTLASVFHLESFPCKGACTFHLNQRFHPPGWSRPWIFKVKNAIWVKNVFIFLFYFTKKICGFQMRKETRKTYLGICRAFQPDFRVWLSVELTPATPKSPTQWIPLVSWYRERRFWDIEFGDWPCGVPIFGKIGGFPPF